MKWKNPVQLFLGLFEPSESREPLQRPPEPVPLVRQASIQSDQDDYGWSVLTNEVIFEFPPRLRKSWRLVRSRQQWVCQLPLVFREAPPSVRQDLLLWLRSALHPSPGSRERRKQAQGRIFAWMTPQLPDRLPKGRAQGQTWDLEALFTDLNRAYFGGTLCAVVRWSPQVGGLSTHRKLETATGSHHLLTISRAYDGAQVPREAVEGVLYHEMCHIAYPPLLGEGRRRVHYREFRQAERRYLGFEAWRAWEAKHMHRQLRILRKGLQGGRK